MEASLRALMIYQWIFSVAFDDEEVVAGEPFVKVGE
jgi:hypothetical protein